MADFNGIRIRHGAEWLNLNFGYLTELLRLGKSMSIDGSSRNENGLCKRHLIVFRIQMANDFRNLCAFKP